MAAHPPDDSVLRNAPKLVPDEPVSTLRAAPVESEGEDDDLAIITGAVIAYPGSDARYKRAMDAVDRIAARLRSQESEPSALPRCPAKDAIGGRHYWQWSDEGEGDEEVWCIYCELRAHVTPLTEEPASEPRTQEDE